MNGLRLSLQSARTNHQPLPHRAMLTNRRRFPPECSGSHTSGPPHFPPTRPAFVKSARFGYLLSAMFAVGILLLLSLAMQHYVERRRQAGHSWMRRGGFLTSTMIGFARALARAMTSEQIARQSGLLQSLDPRVRVIGLFTMVLAAMLSRRIAVVGALFVVAVIIAILSKVSIVMLAKRVWLVVLGFTGVIAFPAIFLTPGDPIAAFAGGPLHITCARCANRYAADRARGNCGDVHVFAGAVHSMDPCAQGAAGLSPAARGDHDAGDDASVYLSSGRNGGPDVRIAPEPDGGRIEGRRGSPHYSQNRWRPAQQEHRAEQRSVPCDAVARIPRRDSNPV